MKNLFKSRKFYALIILVSIAGVIYAYKNYIYKWINNDPVTKIEFVHTPKFTTPQIILNAIYQSHNQGLGYLDFSTEKLVYVLSHYNWIKYISVRKIWPNKLLININEYKPYAYWTNGLQVGYVTEDGNLFYSPQQLTQNENFRNKFAEQQHNLDFELVNNQPYNAIQIDPPPHLPLFISNQEYIKTAIKYWKLSNAILNSQNIYIKELRVNSLNSWSIQTTNNLILNLDNVDIVKTLTRYIIAAREIPVPKDDLIAHIDLRYNNGFAVDFVSKNKYNTNPALIPATLIPGYGGQPIFGALFAPLLNFDPNYDIPVDAGINFSISYDDKNSELTNNVILQKTSSNP